MEINREYFEGSPSWETHFFDAKEAAVASLRKKLKSADGGAPLSLMMGSGMLRDAALRLCFGYFTA